MNGVRRAPDPRRRPSSRARPGSTNGPSTDASGCHPRGSRRTAPTRSAGDVAVAHRDDDAVHGDLLDLDDGCASRRVVGNEGVEHEATVVFQSRRDCPERGLLLRHRAEAEERVRRDEHQCERSVEEDRRPCRPQRTSTRSPPGFARSRSSIAGDESTPCTSSPRSARGIASLPVPTPSSRTRSAPARLEQERDGRLPFGVHRIPLVVDIGDRVAIGLRPVPVHNRILAAPAAMMWPWRDSSR